jgi:hypothetical protein
MGLAERLGMESGLPLEAEQTKREPEEDWQGLPFEERTVETRVWVSNRLETIMPLVCLTP